jgi:hypothetical protein
MAKQPLKYTALGVTLLASAFSQAQLFGPTTYVQASDSPWNSVSFDSYYLEDFEDVSFNVPGVTKSESAIVGPGGQTDSVDADDGTIDGSGTLGHNLFFSNGAAGIEFTFNASVLGSLPTHAGIVWTDGAGTITFEAFDANHQSLGTLTGNHADGSFNGTTADDRFYGLASTSGIGSIKIKNTIGGIEVDHLQYGVESVPEPFSIVGIATCVAILRRKRKK